MLEELKSSLTTIGNFLKATNQSPHKDKELHTRLFQLYTNLQTQSNLLDRRFYTIKNCRFSLNYMIQSATAICNTKYMQEVFLKKPVHRELVDYNFEVGSYLVLKVI